MLVGGYDAMESPPIQCANWREIAELLQEYPLPKMRLDEGEVTSAAWAFRGVQRATYNLEPGIEREARNKAVDWAALEALALDEFKLGSRALAQARIPTDDLSWLALMQHYGVPTRLLDLTYSPFVALYFAIRQAGRCSRCDVDEPARVWAFDIASVSQQFRSVALAAKRTAAKKERERKSKSKGAEQPQFRAISFHPDSFSTERDEIVDSIVGPRAAVVEAYGATSFQRGEQNRRGCVGAALPAEFNPRLACQQGLFLINCAEGATLGQSLSRMMKGKADWYRRYDIAPSAFRQIEEQLFKMNIHEQALFPDLDGLAGLVRQKALLLWSQAD